MTGSGTCLNVREEPTLEAAIIGCYPDDTEFPHGNRLEFAEFSHFPVGFVTYWLQVETDEDKLGWAVTEFLSFDVTLLEVDYSVPVHPRGTTTGVRLIDAVIEAMEGADRRALGENLIAQMLGCVAEPTMGIGNPPECEDGEPVGTEIEVFYSSACEGYWSRFEDVNAALIIDGAPRIYAIHEIDSEFSSADYGLVFAVASGGERMISVGLDSGGIVGVHWTCDGYAHERTPNGRRLLEPLT